ESIQFCRDILYTTYQIQNRTKKKVPRTKGHTCHPSTHRKPTKIVQLQKHQKKNHRDFKRKDKKTRTSTGRAQR
ncbi:hypothetical protein SERLA73DRAFT_185091, partial [Serpula lacrymans var. lacrymans S7.3]